MARLQLERDPLAFIQSRKSGTLDGGDMHECILAAVIGADESIAFGCVEPFHGSSSHLVCILVLVNVHPRFREWGLSADRLSKSRSLSA